MRSRALKIAMRYLAEHNKYSQTELTEDDSKEEKTLDNNQVLSAIEEALDTYYRSYLDQWMKNADLGQLLAGANYIVSQFHSSDSPKLQLKEELGNIKTKFLRAIEEVAKSDTNSIKDTVYSYFKKNPVEDVEVIEDYVKKMLTDIKNTTKRQIPKWKGAV